MQIRPSVDHWSSQGLCLQNKNTTNCSKRHSMRHPLKKYLAEVDFYLVKLLFKKHIGFIIITHAIFYRQFSHQAIQWYYRVSRSHNYQECRIMVWLIYKTWYCVPFHVRNSSIVILNYSFSFYIRELINIVHPEGHQNILAAT